MHLPSSVGKRGCAGTVSPQYGLSAVSLLTLSRALEYDIEFLHVVIDERDLVVTHHELHDIGLYPSLRTAHLASPRQATLLEALVHRSLGLRWRVPQAVLQRFQRDWSTNRLQVSSVNGVLDLSSEALEDLTLLLTSPLKVTQAVLCHNTDLAGTRGQGMEWWLRGAGNTV